MTVTENKNLEEFNTTKKFDLSGANARPAGSVKPTRRVAGSPAQQGKPARPAQFGVVRKDQQSRPAQNQGAAKPTRQPQNQPSSGAQPNRTVQNGVPQKPIPQNQNAPVRTARPVQPKNMDEAQTQNIDLKRSQTETAVSKPEVNGKMMQTRVASEDLAAELKKEEKKRESAEKTKEKGAKKKKKERTESANTVISAIKAVVYIIFVIVIAAFLAAGLIKIGNDVFAFSKSDEIVEVTIPENANTEDIASILTENRIIAYPKIFSKYADFRHYDDSYLAGTYSVSPSMNYDMLLSEFKPKAVSGTVEITIPEGFTTDEIIDLMIENGIGTREGFVDVIENGDFDYWFVKELEEDGVSEDRIYRLDGYLFPDTYQFYLASSEWTVVNKLLKRFSQIFTREYRDQCDALGYSVDEIVTLASIIEKEAASPSEFFLVSSVFHNRLNAWQSYPRFESDATVVYAIQHETGERTVDLDYDTPYNTYKYDSFPPGPIANPSASAMLAALSPQSTNYYFFISDNGQTYFSATKAEHDAYIEKFRNQNGDQPNADIPQN